MSRSKSAKPSAPVSSEESQLRAEQLKTLFVEHAQLRAAREAAQKTLDEAADNEHGLVERIINVAGKRAKSFKVQGRRLVVKKRKGLYALVPPESRTDIVVD